MGHKIQYSFITLCRINTHVHSLDVLQEFTENSNIRHGSFVKIGVSNIESKEKIVKQALWVHTPAFDTDGRVYLSPPRGIQICDLEFACIREERQDFLMQELQHSIAVWSSSAQEFHCFS